MANLVEITSDMLQDLVDLNNVECFKTTVPHVTSEKMAAMIEVAPVKVAALDENNNIIGFSLAMTNGQTDENTGVNCNPGYRWFDENYDSFYYSERIVVHEDYHQTGLGTELFYKCVDAAEADGKTHVVGEIIIRPYNRASVEFHENRAAATKVHEIDYNERVTGGLYLNTVENLVTLRANLLSQ